MKIKLFLLVSILTFFIAAPARAFSIAPVKTLLTVNPGTSQSVVVKIQNSEKNDLQFRLSVLGIQQDQDGRPVFLRDVSIAESWVYPENNQINIKSGETKSVNFIIKIPDDAVSGSYYLGLAVEPVVENGGKASLTTRLNSLLTVEVKGLVRESLSIDRFEPSSDIAGNNGVSSDGKTGWKFNLNLTNDGTIEVLMRGKIVFRNWKGEELFSEPIVLGNKLLAGSKRVLHPDLFLKNNINLPGLYSGQVVINYGRTGQTVSAISYIWYFPKWSGIILGGAGLALFIIVVIVVRRSIRYKR